MKTTAQPCSGDRLGLARRGALSASDWQDFATHLSTCPDCRIAWRLGADFDGSAGPAPGDERVVARAARMALASTRPPRTGIVRIAFAAAAVVVAAGVASAAMILHERRIASLGSTRAESTPRRQPRGPGAARSSPPGPALPAERGLSPEGTSGVEMNGATPAGVAVQRPAASPAPSVNPRSQSTNRERASTRALALAPGPMEMQPSPLGVPEPARRQEARDAFARAVGARREGRPRDAIAAFRQLQTAFPGTPEALVSLVSMGDLCLAAREPAAALAAFDAYARDAPTGALIPEALAGRARALNALGRLSDGEATWRDLARRFPGAPVPLPRARAANIDGIRP